MKRVVVLFCIILFNCKDDNKMATVVISGQTYNNSDSVWNGVNISRSEPTDFSFLNNKITSVNDEGYQLQAGDELVGSTNNNLDGEIISGNQFIWNGSQSDSITHAVFAAFNKNVHIRYNYVLRGPMALIRKSDGEYDTSGGIYYNIVNNAWANAVNIKGMSGVKVYNNTFYSSRTMGETWRGIVHIYSNDNPVASAEGTDIKNNIFYTVNQIYNISLRDADCVSGFKSDYNIFYCESGGPIFEYLGASKTFAEWQGLGYDLHSTVVDPDFVDFVNFVPTARLDYGTNLGVNYSVGLTLSAEWVVGLSPATISQDSNWQVGARLFGTAIPISGDYYIATTGNDGNPGTISQPFLTPQKAVDVMSPGDLAYMRGGTYDYLTPTIGYSQASGVYIDKRGSAGSIYRLYAYPGEHPIIDCSNFTGTSYARNGILLQDASYWHIKGIEVTRADQTSGPVHGGSGIWQENSDHITVENCISHHNGGGGFGVKTQSGDETIFINCDSYSNYDPYSGLPGDNADGWTMGYTSGDYTITLIGCRSWDNSDDGYDCFEGVGYSSIYTFINCWAWHNGYEPGTENPAGQGCGFKLGLDEQDDYSITRRFLYNCIAYNNRSRGFSQESAEVKKEFYNCVAYYNRGHGFSFIYFDVPDIVRNCISFFNDGDAVEDIGTIRTSDHNSWDGGVTASTIDFVSLTSQLTNSRRSDNNLPLMTFLHLKSGSDLIGAGSSTGIYSTDGDGNYWDSPPSLGTFAYMPGGGGGGGGVGPASITVTGTGGTTTITVNDGRLQMIATVLPSNANQSVIWSMINGTGIGVISSSGVLTALTDGTVTVRATAIDGSGIYGQLTITFSNQTTSDVIPLVGDFSLRDVNDIVLPPIATLRNNFWTAGATLFDPTHVPRFDPRFEGDHDRLSNFRNYPVLESSADKGVLYNWYAINKQSSDNADVYGGLYNWYAATKANVRFASALYNWYSLSGTFITGWHVPTTEELDTMEAYLTNNGYGYYGVGSAETAKSVAATTHRRTVIVVF